MQKSLRSRAAASILGAFALMMSGSALAADITVNNVTGPITTIADAITAATAGDRILVQHTGTDYDSVATITVNKSVTIEGVPGAGGVLPIVKQSTGAQQNVILINANNVTIKNLHIKLTQQSGGTQPQDHGIFADNTSSRVFDNLVVDSCTFSVDAYGGSLWDTYGVRANSTTTTVVETVTVRNSLFTTGTFLGTVIAPGTQGYRGVPTVTYLAKSMRFRDCKVVITGNDSMGYFRDIHFEVMRDTYVQNNTFRTSVESNEASSGTVQILDNRFTGEYYDVHRYQGTNLTVDGTARVGNDQLDKVAFDGDYLIFNKNDGNAVNDPDYSGPIPTMVPGYQDELLFIKSNTSNVGAPTRVVIDRNYFVTRRFGINLGRSTNVTIKRNLFVTDAATDAPLPNPNPFGIAYQTKRHINIDSNWFLTCCANLNVPNGFDIEIVANDFEGTNVVAVNTTSEMPARHEEGGGSPGAASQAGTIGSTPSSPDFSNFTLAGNDFDQTVTAFSNDYDDEPQDFELDENFFGSASGPAPGQIQNNTGSGAGFVTTVDTATSTRLVDTDGDTLLDSEETTLYGTNPLVADTDGDGLSDGIEVASASDPLNAESPIAGGASNPVGDADNDGVPDNLDTNSSNPDANGDRIKDGYALAVAYSINGVVTLGDVNADGIRNNSDAAQILEVFLQIRTLSGTSNDYDVNRDGKIDNVDAVILYGWSLNAIPYIPFP